MADQQSNSLSDITGFAALAERLMIKNGTKQTDKLNKNIEGLNKSILSLAKKILPNSGLGESISDISANRRSYDSVGDIVRSRIFGRNRERTFKTKFGSIRSTLNTFGIVKKDSGSMFDEILERRDVRNQFITDQLKVNPQMADTAENRKSFGKKFDIQQRLQKELNSTQGEINRLRQGGFTDKQIARSGLIKQRDTIAAKLAASDNRLYSKIKDEVLDSVKEGIMDGIMDAAKEAQKELKKMDKEAAKYDRRHAASRKLQSAEEDAREEEEIQKGILKAQEDLLNTVKDIKDSIDDEKEKQPVEKKESSIFSWLKGILGTISRFLITKVTGIVGLLTSGISTVLSPILKFLGVGKTAEAVSRVAGKAVTAGAVAGGAVAAKGVSAVVDKVKGIVKSVAPRIPAAARITAGLLLSKPAMIAAAVTGAGMLGYSMLSDENKKSIDNKVAKLFGDNSEEKIAKNSKDEQLRIEKVNSRLGDIVERKTQEVREINNKKTEVATIINSPTTNNSSNSITNNHIKTQPRNCEPTYNRYITNRFALN